MRPAASQQVQDIVQQAMAFGYEACGIINVSELNGYEAKVSERILRFPTTASFYEWLRAFAEPQKKYPWARAVIVGVRSHRQYRTPKNLQGHIARSYLFDMRRDGPDYEASVSFTAWLRQQNYRAICHREDGIVGLRYAAVKAGLGIVRKNNFFYTEQGSWCEIEAWLIDKPLEYKIICDLPPCPENCSLCIQKCPTCALSAPYATNGLECLARLNTFAADSLPFIKYGRKTQQWLYGCDICQDVCPFNRGKITATTTLKALETWSEEFSLAGLMAKSTGELDNLLGRRFWYIQAGDAWQWQTSALGALVNDYRPAYKKLVEAALRHPNPCVREVAQWAKTELMHEGKW